MEIYTFGKLKMTIIAISSKTINIQRPHVDDFRSVKKKIYIYEIENIFCNYQGVLCVLFRLLIARLHFQPYRQYDQ
jgi:hypothetical protein